MKIAYPLLLAWLMLFSSTSFGAIVNGGFENGFDAWEVQGITSFEGDYRGIAPPVGSYQALLVTTGNGEAGYSIDDMAGWLNTTKAAISAVKPDPFDAYNGSAIKRTITVDNPGDMLHFSWNFLTSEAETNNVPPTTPDTPRDTAFFSLFRVVDSASNIFYLADPGDAKTNLIVAPVGTEKNFAREVTYQTLDHVFTESGSYVLGFGVFNRSDGITSSGLLIDNVRLTAVPEPTALAGLGLVGLVLTMRRRRRR